MLIWDVHTGAAQLRLEGHRGWVRSVAFSPDGSQLASGSVDGTLRIWDVNRLSFWHICAGPGSTGNLQRYITPTRPISQAWLTALFLYIHERDDISLRQEILVRKHYP